jgi:type IX secretion system PorP/SprF family membrane protein
MRKLNRILMMSVLAMITMLQAHGQQRPIQSLYMFDPLLINPAYAGNHIQLSGTAIYRNQWVNLDGAPKTFTATVHSGFYKSKVGLGIILGNDQIGIHNDFSFYGAYSYKIKLSNDGILSMGLQGGFNNLRSDYNRLNLKNVNDLNLSGVVSKINPNIGTGLYYSQKNFYFGFSIPQLINNKVLDQPNITVNSLSKQARYYYINTGFSKKLSNNVKWVPSTLIRFQEEAPLSFDINNTIVLYDAVGLGVSYRLKEGFVGLFELQLNENFHVGYAYDFTTSALNNFSNGSHEIMVNYRVKIQRIHRGLECPTYW